MCTRTAQGTASNSKCTDKNLCLGLFMGKSAKVSVIYGFVYHFYFVYSRVLILNVFLSALESTK